MIKYFLLLFLIFLSACGEGYARFQAQRDGVFGTTAVFMGYAQNERAFAQHAEYVFQRLDELHRLFDMSAVNANAGIAPVAVPREVIDMLLAAREAYIMTDGKTNITLGPVLRIWHDYRAEGLTLPFMDNLYAAARYVDMSRLIIDETGGTVFLEDAGMSLDAGSVAKGFAAGLVMEETELSAAVLNIGGHIVAKGTPPGRDFWNIAFQDDTVHFTDAALSVSGGETFGHIIDPDTLLPAMRFRQAAVIHPCSWTADALSTALFILSEEEGDAMAKRYGAVAFRLLH